MKIKQLVGIFTFMCVIGVPGLYAQFTGGAGLMYGTYIDEPGIQVNGYYAIPAVEKLSVGGDLSFFLPHKHPGWKESIWELNLNAHYSLYKQEKVDLYGLAGINITGYKVKYTGDSFYTGASASTSKGGLNIGGGAQTNVGFGKLYGEIKYAVISDIGHLVLTAGVRLPI